MGNTQIINLIKAEVRKSIFPYKHFKTRVLLLCSTIWKNNSYNLLCKSSSESLGHLSITKYHFYSNFIILNKIWNKTRQYSSLSKVLGQDKTIQFNSVPGKWCVMLRGTCMRYLACIAHVLCYRMFSSSTLKKKLYLHYVPFHTT